VSIRDTKSLHEVIVQLLVDAGASINRRGGEYGESGLHLDADIGNRVIVHKLLEARADINSRTGPSKSGESALHKAANRGYDEVLGCYSKQKQMLELRTIVIGQHYIVQLIKVMKK
jgi:ankyrin repeat protein